MIVQQLNQRFALPGVLLFERGQGNLPRIHVESETCEAVLYLHGAHLVHWQPRGHHPVIFTSHRSRYAEGHPIRGGVPIVFPWFAQHPSDAAAPMHGLVRQRPWRVERTEARDGVVLVTLAIDLNAQESTAWPFDAALRLIVELGEHLNLTLHVQNRSANAITFESALHTYLAIGDVQQTTVHGLEKTRYIDKVDQFKEKWAGREPATITGETDRVYLDTTAPCHVDDPTLRRRITVSKSGSCSTVLWNPWIEKAARMADFGPDEWKHMLCLETANIGPNAVTLPAGATHAMGCHISVAHMKA